MFSAGPLVNYTGAGVYNVSVSSLTINGVVYGKTSISNTVASPNSFQLIVVAIPLAPPFLNETITSSF